MIPKKVIEALDIIQAQLLDHTATACRICNGPFNNFLDVVEHSDECPVTTIINCTQELEDAKETIYHLAMGRGCNG